MSEDFIDIDVYVGAALEVPEWLWDKNPFRVRVYRSALEEARGQIPDGMSLERAYVDVRSTIDTVAERKIKAAAGSLDQPILIDRTDIWD